MKEEFRRGNLLMKELLDSRQAAKVVNVRPRTLEGWRRRGCGPPFIRLSPRAVRYRIEDLERWIEEHRVTDESSLERILRQQAK